MKNSNSQMIPNIDDRKAYRLIGSVNLSKLFRSEPCPNQSRKRDVWFRNYAITILILDAKISNEELLNLRLSDVDFVNNLLTIQRRNGDKERIVKINNISITALKLYLMSGVRPFGCTPDEHLFGTTARTSVNCIAHWHKATSSWLSETVKRHVYDVTGLSNICTDLLRKSFHAVDLYNAIPQEELYGIIMQSRLLSGKTICECVQAYKVYRERDNQAVNNQEMLSAMSS